MRHRFIALLVLFTVIFFSSAEAQTTARKFEAGKNTFLLDGKPFVVKAAELHYTRIPQAYWDHRIEMCKALGMNTICIYIFWNIQASLTLQVRMISLPSVVPLRNTECMSSSAPVRMCVRNGKWAACPGGC